MAWALRLLLLAAATGALAVALFGGPRPAPSNIVYSCPMHPAVRARAPGACPVCGMALVAAAPPAADTAADRAALPPTDLIFVRRHLFPVAVRAPAWIAPDGQVVARLYRDEAHGLSAGASGTFTPASHGSAAFPVALSDVPARPWSGEVVELTFRATASAAAPEAPVVGWISLATPPAPVLTVDEKVVFTAGETRYVLLADRDGRVSERRPVELGRVINGRAVVVAGLAEGDRVVRRRAFFLDADQRAREASLVAGPPP